MSLFELTDWRVSSQILVLVLVHVAVSPAFAAPKAEKELEIVGWVERVRILDPDVHLDAKLDTGAATSSLDVEIIRKYRKGNKRW
ncbi:MAG: RimK/LysX family protein, partial [Lysobacterales bacterium]